MAERVILHDADITDEVSASIVTSVDVPGKAGLVIVNPDGSKVVPVPVQTLESSGLVPKVYDYISLSYTGSDLTGVVYKTGGAAGTTVATLTLTYNSSILSSITRT